jgi:hypothetical protein
MVSARTVAHGAGSLPCGIAFRNEEIVSSQHGVRDIEKESLLRTPLVDRKCGLAQPLLLAHATWR